MVLLRPLTTADISALPTTGGNLVWDTDTLDLKFRNNVGTSTVTYLDAAGNLDIATHDASSVGLTLGGVLVTASAAELNTLDGITATVAELNILDGVTATAAELNTLDGITATVAELNILDGVTATAAELNYNDLTTGAGTAEASKAVVLDASADVSGVNAFGAASVDAAVLDVSTHDAATVGLSLGGVLVTSSAAELNILDGVTVTAAELNILDGVTATAAELNYNDLTTGPGTAEASKALVLDSSSDITGINSLTATTLAGTLSTAAQPNITSVGTLDDLLVTGNVGMGTLTPQTTLEVADTIPEIRLTDDRTTITGGSDLGKISWYSRDASFGSNYEPVAQIRIVSNNSTVAPDGDIQFLNGIDGTLSVSMVVDANGLVGIGSTNPDKKLEINSETGDCLRLTYNDADGGATNYTDLLVDATGNLTINSSGNEVLIDATDSFDVAGHDGSTLGLKLAGVLVTTTAAELNYNNLTTGAGTAEANKAVVLDGSADVTGINSLSSVLLTSSGTTASTSDTTGVILTAGGIGISNTTDAISTTNGGTLTSAGGAAFAKSVFVGNHLTVGGDLIVNGTTTTIESVTTVIGDNTLLLNSGPAGSGRDAGLITERYQIANDAGTGDVVADTAKESYALDGADASSITLPAGGSAIDDYYNSWWMKMTSGAGINETRRIIDYDGTTKIATLESAFTATPSAADNVSLYNKPYSTFVWQEASNQWVSAFVAADITGALDIIDYADFRCNDLTSSSFSTENIDVTGHDGATAGLSLGGVLVTSTAAELNILDGVTSTTAELNILDGVTATTAELNTLDGITSTVAELNILDGVTSTATELNYNDLTTGPGTAEASKALVLDSSSDITGINSLTATTLVGTLSTAAQPNITSVGTLTSLLIANTGAADLLTLQSSDDTLQSALQFTPNGQEWEMGANGSANAFPSSFYVKSGTTYRMSITDAGLVGIGDTIPTEKLTIRQGNVKMTELNGYVADKYVYSEWADGANTHSVGLEFDYYAGSGSQSSTHSRVNFVSNAIFGEDIYDAGKLTTMSVLSNGRVGVGTILPGKALEINSATGDCLRLTYNDADGAATNYTDFAVDATGILTINSSGNEILIDVTDSFDVAGHDGSTLGLKLAGVLVTSTAAELNILDGVTVTATELNILDGVTSTAAELNYNDLTTGPGTAEASKALVLDSSSDITGINSLTSTTINATTLNVTGDAGFIVDSAVGNTPLCPLSITRTTSDTPAAGLGVCMKFDIENSVNVNTTFGTLEVSATTITDAAEDGKFSFKLINAGTEAVEAASIANDGTFTCNNVVETSDIRVKENITPVNNLDSFQKIMDINIVDYNFIADSQKVSHRGVIAQELKEVIPNAVMNVGTKNGIENFNAVSTRELVGYLISAIQHLNSKLDK